MSQVIVTDDVLNVKRQESRLQEEKITQDPRIKLWSKSDITGKDPVAIVAGLAFLPILAIWTCILGMMMLMFSFIRYLFKGLGMVIGGSKSLIIRGR